MYINISNIKKNFNEIKRLEIIMKNDEIKIINLDDRKSVYLYYDGSIICRDFNNSNYERIFVSSIKEIKTF